MGVDLASEEAGDSSADLETSSISLSSTARTSNVLLTGTGARVFLMVQLVDDLGITCQQASLEDGEA